MKDTVDKFPPGYQELLDETEKAEFNQLSDPLLGLLLATLSATKPNGRFLELGTGSGLSTAWMLHGMDTHSSLVTIDNDERLVSIARRYLDDDWRVEFIIGDGAELISDTEPDSIDFIFADTWPGKYHHLDEALSLLKNGGIYVIDDMLPQDGWPEGHSAKANDLVHYLESRDDFLITKMSWSTGIIIGTRKV